MRKFFLAAAMTVVLLLSCVSVFAAQSGPPPAKETPNKAPLTAGAHQEEKPVPEPVIKFGNRGEQVLKVQRLLADSGFYAGELDGIFGGGTLQAVKDFQAVYNLPSDGVVNRETFSIMERASSEPSRGGRALAMIASAYTAYDDGCGSTTYRGHTLRKGLVAVDPGVIPLGTRLYIPGYGYAIADDIGGAIKGHRIDLAYESRSEALQFGVQRVTVYILE